MKTNKLVAALSLIAIIATASHEAARLELSDKSLGTKAATSRGTPKALRSKGIQFL